MEQGDSPSVGWFEEAMVEGEELPTKDASGMDGRLALRYREGGEIVGSGGATLDKGDVAAGERPRDAKTDASMAASSSAVNWDLGMMADEVERAKGYDTSSCS